MEEHHRVRLGQILWRSRLGEWDRKGIEERCVGWWPSLAAFVAEQLSGTKAPPPAELVGVLEALGQSWMADEQFSLLEDDGGEAGVFVIRTW